MTRIALAGAGAFGIKHLDGLQKIDGVEIVSIVSRNRGAGRRGGGQNMARGITRPNSPTRSRAMMSMR